MGKGKVGPDTLRRPRVEGMVLRSLIGLVEWILKHDRGSPHYAVLGGLRARAKAAIPHVRGLRGHPGLRFAMALDRKARAKAERRWSLPVDDEVIPIHMSTQAGPSAEPGNTQPDVPWRKRAPERRR